jgi:hypothetical protein
MKNTKHRTESAKMNSFAEIIDFPSRAQVRHINSPGKQATMKKAKARRANVSRKSCEDKVRYRDRHEANRALQRIRNARFSELDRLGATKRGETRKYHCPNCLGWHLASGDRFADMAQHPSQQAA